MVTLSDWANIGGDRTIGTLRPGGKDSLARRLKKNRTTKEDVKYLKDLAIGHQLKLATLDELKRLLELLQSRYGHRPRTAVERKAIAIKVVDEIAQHTGKSNNSVWKMTIGRAGKAIAGLPALHASKGLVDSSPSMTNTRARGFLGGTELADALGIPEARRDAFFTQFRRYRRKLPDKCWKETEHTPNSPKFLYQADSPQILELASKYLQ